MITFMDSNGNLDPQLWNACAGGMVQMPQVNSKVFYFPQGHAEHASGPVDFRRCPRLPPYILCRVSAIKYLADPVTDEVYAKIRLVPVKGKEIEEEDDGMDGVNVSDNLEKPASFAKTLTQSDANNGGGFSVPRYCADTIFPRLNRSANPPAQSIFAKDVHGETWEFKHIYRGKPRRHLLTTGWSNFVNQKKLVAGDSIVFLRAHNGDLCLGIRRVRRGTLYGSDPYGGISEFLSGENKLMKTPNANGLSSKVTSDAVLEAANLAANGHPFEVVYYPRGSTPDFCVKASSVKSALQIRWCSGMKFKMAFETEDSSRISWFEGTITSVQVADPHQWPNSPWRLLQVSWDEPDLLQTVKRVSPWLVELVPDMPSIHLSPFSPPTKKMRMSQHSEFPLDGQIQIPTFSNNILWSGYGSPFSCLPNTTTPAGMQGARHSHYGLSLPDLHLNSMHSDLFPASFRTLDHVMMQSKMLNAPIMQNLSMSENTYQLLTAANPTTPEKVDDVKTHYVRIFGQLIPTDQQKSLSSTSETPSPVRTGKVDKIKDLSGVSGSDLNEQAPSRQSFAEWFLLYKNTCEETEPSLETSQTGVSVSML